MAIGAAVCLLAFLFLHLGNEVREGETAGFDDFFLQAAQALRLGHPWAADVMRDLSGLGSTLVLTLFSVGVCGYLWLISARSTAAVVATSIGSAALGVEVLKLLFARVRPDVAYAQFAASGLSFPSGHTSMSAVVFMTFGALLARMHERRAERIYIVIAAIVLTVLIGMSRAGLGVHWATDVIGGWAFGAAGAAVWLLVARRLDPS